METPSCHCDCPPSWILHRAARGLPDGPPVLPQPGCPAKVDEWITKMVGRCMKKVISSFKYGNLGGIYVNFRRGRNLHLPLLLGRGASQDIRWLPGFFVFLWNCRIKFSCVSTCPIWSNGKNAREKTYRITPPKNNKAMENPRFE